MKLTTESIRKLPASNKLFVPAGHAFSIPEKILQFGTGVLLRGLPDLIINNANNRGAFNGRIVMVKSTANGNADVFDDQDCLYTVCMRGVKDDKNISENYIVASVSRVLSAANEWDRILECAANPEMQIIISNTTEVGITLTKDNIHADPPQSFPGKLLSFLYHRFKYFNGDVAKGMIIIPTELIPFNADKLLSIVLELAHINNLEITFIDWLENANYFCNSLVDRIVPGSLNDPDQVKIEKILGYEDELMIMSELYGLWAIQANNEYVKSVLSFATGDSAVVIAADINKFRELKLRLLNGVHSFSCGLAYLAGFDTVKDVMDDEDFLAYLKQLTFSGIIPSITNDQVTVAEAEDFASKVLDRFRNHAIDHNWLSIAMQYSSKMCLRNIPVIENYDQRFKTSNDCMTLGMAGYILFMRSEKAADEQYYGNRTGHLYLINDDNAKYFSEVWREKAAKNVVHTILSNEELWGINLYSLNGFGEKVNYWLRFIETNSVHAALEKVVKLKVDANGK